MDPLVIRQIQIRLIEDLQLLTVDDVASILKVNRVTLNDRYYVDLLKPLKLSTRAIRYHAAEVKAAIENLKARRP